MRGRGLRLEVRDNLGDLVDVIEYAISGLDRLDRKIPKRGRFKGSDSLGEMWADDWLASSALHFRTQGRSNGVRWPTYDQTAEREVYEPIKASIFGRAMTRMDVLRWHGSKHGGGIGEDRLFRSFTRRRARGNVERIRRTSLVVGSSLPYAGRHDQGAGRAPRHLGGHAIPRRPLLTIGADRRRRLEDSAIRYAAALSADFGVRSENLPPPSARRR